MVSLDGIAVVLALTSLFIFLMSYFNYLRHLPEDVDNSDSQ